MSCAPSIPQPISPNFNNNVDVLIQDLLKNMSGTGFNDPYALLQRMKTDQAVIFEILEKLKYFNANTGCANWDGGNASSIYTAPQIINGGGA